MMWKNLIVSSIHNRCKIHGQDIFLKFINCWMWKYFYCMTVIKFIQPRKLPYLEDPIAVIMTLLLLHKQPKQQQILYSGKFQDDKIFRNLFTNTVQHIIFEGFLFSDILKRPFSSKINSWGHLSMKNFPQLKVRSRESLRSQRVVVLTLA